MLSATPPTHHLVRHAAITHLLHGRLQSQVTDNRPRLGTDTILLRPTIPWCSSVILDRVIRAQRRHLDRAGKLNSTLTTGELGRLSVDPKGKALIQTALATNRVRHQPALLAVARTIADLAGAEVISSEHLSEALSWQ